MSLLRYLAVTKFYLGCHLKPIFSERFYSTCVEKMIRAAIVQLNVGLDKTENLENALCHIREAAKKGAKLVALPECFNSPYGTKFFDEYAEVVCKGPTSDMLSKAAKENCIYLVGGTFPERDDCKIYNTCTVWDPKGELVAKYRKMHLFDIDIPGKITFKESEILKPGNELAIFCMDGIKIGLGICYDMRFEELAKLYRLEGCDILIYPGAFNMTTGPLHWELLQRGRAVDNQVFFLGVSPARGTQGYIAWGHSQITSPWGEVVARAGPKQEIVCYDIDLKQCTEVRQQIPVFIHRRTDLYNTIKLKK